ncbi:hypothetical protein HOD20_08575 [archaeon]|jgi:hypothetical protein|nr:hypothetical protein [archaeon]MBT4352564.1 hypothetical protein [archaeon]MBT4648585.1 hypothetical protein [archaeon]MBT6821412.1 hypothetical protein [archaeon]MBT7393007.1 hypothetical protein [archaeon]
MLSEISKVLDKRRTELTELLENKSGEIEIEKQHQIFGAINEIDVMVQTLEYYRAKELREPTPEIKLIGPQESGSTFKKLFNNINKVFKNR